MNNLNSILLEGNLVKDPELRNTPKGTPVCQFSMASNRYQQAKNAEEVSFFDVEVWSRLAENCGEYLKKGRGVRVIGRLKQDRWTNNDGRNRSKVKIVGEHVEFKPFFSTGSKGEADKGKDAEEGAGKAAGTEDGGAAGKTSEKAAAELVAEKPPEAPAGSSRKKKKTEAVPAF